MINSGLGFLVAVCLFALGYYIGATEYEGAFTGVTWTDIGTLFVTFFGFAFGFLTYFQWQSGKRKEDAYSAAKHYVAALDEVDEHLHELLFQYNHICPASGVVLEGKDASSKRFEHLNSLWHYLYEARHNLHKAYRELSFWHVKLSHESAKDYNQTLTLLSDISVVCSALNNQLFQLISNDAGGTSGVARAKERFDELYNELHQIAQRRVQHGFKAMFRFGG